MPPSSERFDLSRLESDLEVILDEWQALCEEDRWIVEVRRDDARELAGAYLTSLGQPQPVVEGPDGPTREGSVRFSLSSASTDVTAREILYLHHCIAERLGSPTAGRWDAEAVARLATITGWMILVGSGAIHARLQGESLRNKKTGLLNKLAFEADLPRILSRASAAEPTALVVIDVDGLKRINDLGGHMAGDRAIGRLAAAINSRRPTDSLAYHWGGDEFALLVPFPGSGDIRSIITAVEMDDPPVFSWGAAAFPTDATNASDLFDRADKAMYRLKRRHKSVVGRLAALAKQVRRWLRMMVQDGPNRES